MLWLWFHIGAVPFLVNVVSHILQFVVHVNEIFPLISNFSMLLKREKPLLIRY